MSDQTPVRRDIPATVNGPCGHCGVPDGFISASAEDEARHRPDCRGFWLRDEARKAEREGRPNPIYDENGVNIAR